MTCVGVIGNSCWLCRIFVVCDSGCAFLVCFLDQLVSNLKVWIGQQVDRRVITGLYPVLSVLRECLQALLRLDFGQYHFLKGSVGFFRSNSHWVRDVVL